MSKRRRGPDALPDWHLWTAVTRTVRPLRPLRDAALADAPLLMPGAAAAPAPKPLAEPQRPAAPHLRQKRPAEGIEPKLKRKVSRGRIEIEGTIDLHGMRAHEAEAALGRFVLSRAARGARTLLVITGKGGRRNPEGEAEPGVLRSLLPLWLSRPDLALLVAGWDSAAQGHGGEGAFYVRLRRGEGSAP